MLMLKAALSIALSSSIASFSAGAAAFVFSCSAPPSYKIVSFNSTNSAYSILSSSLLFKRNTKSHSKFWISFSIVHGECTTDGTVITDLTFSYIDKERVRHTNWRLTKGLIEIVAARNSYQMASAAVFAIKRVDKGGKFCLICFIFSKRYNIKVDLIKYLQRNLKNTQTFSFFNRLATLIRSFSSSRIGEQIKTIIRCR